jgi:preprotein translocase subunit SecA
MESVTTAPTPAEAAGCPVTMPARASMAHRLGPRWRNHLLRWVGLPWQRRLARAALVVPAIRHWQRTHERLGDDDLTAAGRRLRGRARGGEPLDRLLPEAFGLAAVAVRRLLGLEPFDVQLAAAVVLHQGGLVELATGEGKTLVAALPAFLNALTGKGVHVATVNDYLARRDAEWLGPVYRALGLRVGVVEAQMADPDRAAAYRCDVTYGVASTFGFDFLRDRLKATAADRARFWTPWTAPGDHAHALEPRVQNGHPFALVDEVDNIFIDEARTPLVISTPGRKATEAECVPYRWAHELAVQMQRGVHFHLDDKTHKLLVTRKGLEQLRWSGPPLGADDGAMDTLFKMLEQALHANHRLRRDQHYLVEDDKVVIIDEFTGRRMPDRNWGQGLHQAVEAKEAVPISKSSDHAAQVTFQSYFRLYGKLAGMTGTAAQDRWELRRVYKLWVVCVPTNRRVCRQHWPDRVFPTESAKFVAVVAEVARLHAEGRPVLIGTRSVEKSEALSQLLREAGIGHQVLNARHNEEEARIVARAGQRGQVTIATNMAGRGTDIKLGPGVAELGGLHVLGTERHEARRIDQQLAGRAGRQGDPGSCQFFLSLEDELLEGLGPVRQERLRRAGQKGGHEDWRRYHRFFLAAQRRLERKHYRQRVDLLSYTRQRREMLDDLGADPFVD